MRTLFFCTAWCISQQNMDARCGKWYAYHRRILDRAGLLSGVEIAMIADGIPRSRAKWPDGDYIGVNLFPHLGRGGRGPSWLDREEEAAIYHGSTGRYPGWWRSMETAAHLARVYDCERMIHVESDNYLLSRRSIDVLFNAPEGWMAPNSRTYGFRDSAVQAIVGWQWVAELERVAKHHRETNELAELAIPWTGTLPLVGGREFEKGIPPRPEDDYMGQCPDEYQPVFEGDR
jgi:hypothetical protein